MGTSTSKPIRHVRLLRRAMVLAGTATVVPSLIALVLGMLGLLPVERFGIGASSALRIIASIAVLGCLVAAVGYWDDYEKD